MNLIVSIIPLGKKHTVLGEILPFVVKMADRTLMRQKPDDIVANMMKPDTQLWVVFDKDDKAKLHGYLTTRIEIHAQARHLVLVNCGGIDGSLDACVATVFDTFEKFAIDNQCDGIEFLGRPAWSKFVKPLGYEIPQYQFFKSLRGAA